MMHGFHPYRRSIRSQLLNHTHSDVHNKNQPTDLPRTQDQSNVDTQVLSNNGQSQSSVEPSQSPLTIDQSKNLPSLSSILQMKWPTLQHVPKGCRNDWATLVGNAVMDICHNREDLNQWIKLFMLPKCILANPVRGHNTS